MLRSLSVLASVIALLVAQPALAFAWSDEGHMAIAAIARQLLDPQTRQNIDDWLANQPRGQHRVSQNSVKAATWPDHIRGVDGLDHPLWHHKSLGYSLDNSSLGVADTENAETELLGLIWDYEPEVNKAERIAWIEHLVGDIHQPLHNTSMFMANKPDG